MWKNEFEPALLATLAEAFDMAWSYVEKSPRSFFDDKQVCRDELAAIIVSLAQRGDDNKLLIANRAIEILRDARRHELSSRHHPDTTRKAV
jgi:hypothetical protein